MSKKYTGSDTGHSHQTLMGKTFFFNSIETTGCMGLSQARPSGLSPKLLRKIHEVDTEIDPKGVEPDLDLREIPSSYQ